MLASCAATPAGSQAIADAWNAQTASKATELHGVVAKATVEGNKVVFTMEKAPSAIDAAFTATTGAFNTADGKLTQNNAHELTVTVEEEPISNTSGRLYGMASVTLTADHFKDGSTIKIGDSTYVVAKGPNSKYKDMDNVIDLSDQIGDVDLKVAVSRQIGRAHV